MLNQILSSRSRFFAALDRDIELILSRSTFPGETEDPRIAQCSSRRLRIAGLLRNSGCLFDPALFSSLLELPPQLRMRMEKHLSVLCE